jgi:pimeloyl-ACP methyl ester carboxylesterase
METVLDIKVKQMQTNPGYTEAEARVFDRYALAPAMHSLSLVRPRFRLRVVEVGSESREPVVLLHGFSHCTAHWAPLVSRLSDLRNLHNQHNRHSLRYLMLDAPGHSAADAVDFKGVNLRAWYKEMLTGCLDMLGLEQVRLIGHSQGAMQALWLALDAPERVLSVVAAGTPAVAFGARLPGLRILARPGIGRLLISLSKALGAYPKILATTIGPEAVQAHPELVRATFLATHRAGFGKTVSSYLREMFRGADAYANAEGDAQANAEANSGSPEYVLSDTELRRIAQPVLVLWGEDDAIQPIEEARARTALMPHSTLRGRPGWSRALARQPRSVRRSHFCLPLGLA